MNRIEFFNQLEYELQKRGVRDIDNAIRDYEELFIEGMKNGKTEEQIIDGLELPEEIAKGYKTNINAKQGKKELNSKIKTLEFMTLVMVGLIIWVVIDLIRYASIMPGWMSFCNIVICVAAIVLIFTYRKNLGKLKSKEKDLNSLAKKDLEEENE